MPANRSRKPASGSAASSAARRVAGQVHARPVTGLASRRACEQQLHDLTALEQAAAVRAGRGEPHRARRARAAPGSRRWTPGSAPSSPSPPSGRGRRPPRPRRRLRGRRRAAPAARRPDRDQGPQHHRRGADDVRLARVTADFVPDVDDAVVTAAGRRRDDQPGQDQHPGVRLPLLHRQRRGRPRPLPVGPHAAGRRLQRRRGGRGRRGHAAVRAGQDGGGSIRIPAGINGLFGIKPSPRPGEQRPAGREMTGLGTQGPLARTVRDAAAMLDAMAGPVVGRPRLGAAAAAGRDLPGLRRAAPRAGCGSARYRDSGHARRRAGPRGPGRRSTTRRRLLADLGHDVEDVPAGPLTAEVLAAFEVVWALSATTLPVPPDRVDALRPLTRYLRDRGLALSARRTRWRRCSRCGCSPAGSSQATAPYDVLLAPVCTMTPRPVGWFDADGDGAEDFERQKRYARVHRALQRHRPAGGQRAAALDRRPACRSARMLVGRPADEATLRRAVRAAGGGPAVGAPTPRRVGACRR